MTNSITTANSLNPIHGLEDRNNYQRFILIQRNGNIKERIILFINNIELREQVICIHFLRSCVQLFLEEPMGARFTSRDNPWDFEIELSNSEKLTLEITSIADEVDLFRNLKYQERISEKSNYEQIEFHELVKLNDLFPNRLIQEQIRQLKIKATAKNELVDNPHYQKKFIFESSVSEDLQGFDEIIKTSINKKIRKKHINKENVILIIDNRTVSFELQDILYHLEKMDEYFDNLPFKEIWLYTGYYSDFDGNNAEYSFIPLKQNEQKIKKMKTKLK